MGGYCHTDQNNVSLCIYFVIQILPFTDWTCSAVEECGATAEIANRSRVKWRGSHQWAITCWIGVESFCVWWHSDADKMRTAPENAIFMQNFAMSVTPACNRWKIFLLIPYPHYIFSLTTPRCVSNFRDSIKKIENQAEKLHTYATFWSHLCQKPAYCKKSTAWIISRVVPRKRRKIVLSVPYILKIMSRSLWPHGTQTSATNIHNWKVANYFLDVVIVSGPTA